MKNDVNLFASISKVDEEQRMVYGIAQTDTLDNQDEIVEWEATKEAIPEYMKWRNLREMHKDSAVGTVPEIIVKDDQKQLYIGAKVVDKDAWEKVKNGVYKGFSIGGKALERIKQFESDIGKTISRVKKYVLNEISLVDRPANSECVFQVIKRDSFDDDNELSRDDQLGKDVDIMKKIALSLEKKILTKGQINRLSDNSFALIKRDGGKTERLYPIPDKPHARALLKQIMNISVTDGERHEIHEKIKKVLGNKHNLSICEYCRGYVDLLKRGGDNVDIEKLRQAKALLDELLAGDGGDVPTGEEVGEMDDQPVEEEFEGMNGDDSIGAETENIVDAPEKDETEDIPELQGSSYSDKEGGDDEGWGGDEGYEVGMPNDDSRTQLYDTEEERGGKQELEGGDCPYCGSTVKALMSGQFRKGVATCPGCHVEYAVNANPKVVISKRGGAPVRRTNGADSRMVKVLGNLVNVVGNLQDKMEKMEARPVARKMAVTKVTKSESGSDEDLQKGGSVISKELQIDSDKALAIVKSAQRAGRQLNGDEAAFTETVNKRRMEARFGAGK